MDYISQDVLRLMFTYLSINELAIHLKISKYINSTIKQRLKNLDKVSYEFPDIPMIWEGRTSLTSQFHWFIEKNCYNIKYFDVRNMELIESPISRAIRRMSKLQILILPDILYWKYRDNKTFNTDLNIVSVIQVVKNCCPQLRALGINAFISDYVIERITDILGPQLRGVLLSNPNSAAKRKTNCDLTLQYLIKYTNLSVLHINAHNRTKYLVPIKGQLPTYLSIPSHDSIVLLPNLENLIELDMGERYYHFEDLQYISHSCKCLRVLRIEFAYFSEFCKSIDLLAHPNTLPTLRIFGANSIFIWEDTLNYLKNKRPNLIVYDLCNSRAMFSFLSVCQRADIINL